MATGASRVSALVSGEGLPVPPPGAAAYACMQHLRLPPYCWRLAERNFAAGRGRLFVGLRQWLVQTIRVRYMQGRVRQTARSSTVLFVRPTRCRAVMKPQSFTELPDGCHRTVLECLAALHQWKATEKCTRRAVFDFCGNSDATQGRNRWLRHCGYRHQQGSCMYSIRTQSAPHCHFSTASSGLFYTQPHSTPHVPVQFAISSLFLFLLFPLFRLPSLFLFSTLNLRHQFVLTFFLAASTSLHHVTCRHAAQPKKNAQTKASRFSPPAKMSTLQCPHGSILGCGPRVPRSNLDQTPRFLDSRSRQAMHK